MNKRHVLFCLLVLFASFSRLSAATTANICLFWDYDKISEIKDNPEYAHLVALCVQKAESYLALQPLTVMDKTWSFNDDFHYYVTTAGYWWPEERNGRIYYVNRDGQTNPEVKDLDFNKIKEMAERLQYLSLSYFFTRDRRFLQAYKRQLDVWFINKDTYMYPNFEYAQVIPGRDNNRGRPVGLIDAHPFNTILDSFRLIESVGSIGRSRREKVRAWFAAFADWMVDSEIGKGDRVGNSNSSVSYDVTLLNMAEFTQKQDLVKELIAEFPDKRINVQILEDGRLPKELARTNAFSYSIANMRFMVEFCIMSQSLGEDIYFQNRKRFDAAIQFLYHALNNKETFPYKQDGGWKYTDTWLETLVHRFRRLNNTIEKDLSITLPESEVTSMDEWVSY